MSQKIRFPNTRLTPASLGKPVFATDIQNNTENLLEAINMLLGLGAHDFAILSGFDYTPGAPGTYTSGIIYLAGVIYYFDGSVTPLQENQYLAPNPTDTESKVHNPDGNSYNTYTIYYALASNSPITDCPQFVGNMDAYRIDIKRIKDFIDSINIDATTSVRGFVELATNAEVQTGTDTQRAVTPSGLQSKVSSTTNLGIIEIATDAEVIAGTDTDRAITPSGLAAKFAVFETVYIGTITSSGTISKLFGSITCTCSKTGTGIYIITHNINGEYMVTVVGENSGANLQIMPKNIVRNLNTVEVYLLNSSAAADGNFIIKLEKIG